MVSVNEKCFIEKLASENAVKKRSPRKLVSSKANYPSYDNLTYQTPYCSKRFNYNTSDSSWKHLSEEEWTDGTSEPIHCSSNVGFTSDCSSSIQSKKSIVWNHQFGYTSDNLNYQIPSSSKGYKHNAEANAWERQRMHSEFKYEEDWTNGNSELDLSCSSNVSFTSDCSNGVSPKKRIVWNHQMIDNINNILKRSDLNSTSSLSPEKKRSNVTINCFHGNCGERFEHYNKPPGDDLLWNNSPRSLSKERNLHHRSRVNKKRLFSRSDERGIFKKSKVKNFSIQPLDANWKYGSADYDDTASKIKQRWIEVKDWVSIYKPKISLLGDSHTRHLADIITEMLPGFKIEGNVKPGAKSKRVLSSLKDAVQQMGRNDFLVTLSGTNDMWSETLAEPKTVVYNAVMDAKCTNLLMCNVPNNYLEPNDSLVQDNIINFNQFYRDVVNFSEWAHLVNLHQLKDRSLFTRHGLHFNLCGKIKICDLISNKILDVIDLIKMLK